MRKIRAIMFVASLTVAAISVSACGPSEQEVTRMIDTSIRASEQRIVETVNAKNAAASKEMTAANADTVKRIQTSIEASNREAVEDTRAMIGVFYGDVDKDFREVTDLIYDDIDAIAETTQLLVGAVCKSDYWSTTFQSMMWHTLIYLEGGDVALEDIKALGHGMSFSAYNETTDAACFRDEAGFMMLKGQ